MTHTGFFERYFIGPFFRRATDFSGEQEARAACYSAVAWLVVTCGVAGTLLGLVGLLGPEVGFACVWTVGILWLCWSALGFVAMLTRLFRNPDRNAVVKVPRFLGIDRLLTAVCLLFLIFGLLMMITTLNSGELNMNPRKGDIRRPNPILEQDSIFEEPIFTYQDVAPEEPVTDTMPDLAEQDTVSLDESFDPEIATAAPVEIDTAAIEM